MGITSIALCVFSIVVLLVDTTPVIADSTFTISNVNHVDGYGIWCSNGYETAAARFPLSRFMRVHGVSAWANGPKGSTARFRVFLEEGGSAVPLLEKDAIAPLTVTKMRDGLEEMTIDFPLPLDADADQVFVAMDRFTNGIAFLTDKYHRKPACTCPTEQFGYQALKRSGSWVTTPYAYAMDIRVSNIDARHGYSYRIDTLPSSTTSGTFHLFTGDIDSDGFVDIVTPGGCWFGAPSGRPTYDRNISSALRGSEAVMMVNGPGGFGALVNLMSGTKLACSRTRIRGVDIFTISIPAGQHIESCGTGDFDGDGVLDVLFTAFPDKASEGSSGRLHLFKRSGDLMTLLSSVELTGIDAAPSMVVSDIEGNGRWEALLTTVSRSGIQVKRAGLGRDGLFIDDRTLSVLDGRTHTFPSINLVPTLVSRNSVAPVSILTPIVQTRVPQEKAPFVSAHSWNGDAWDVASTTAYSHIDYHDRTSSINVRDLNGDGLDEVVIASIDSCRRPVIYEFTSDRYRRLDIPELAALSGSADIAITDVDNDGRMDLIGYVGGRTIVLHGGYDKVSTPKAFTPIHGGRSLLSHVLIHQDDNTTIRRITFGRGVRTLEYGPQWISSNHPSPIDSVSLHSGPTIVDMNVGAPSNEVTTGGCVSGIDVSPNPFRDQVSLDLHTTSSVAVTIQIVDQLGKTVVTLPATTATAGKTTLHWNGRDHAGNMLPSGTYTIVVSCPHGTGRYSLVRL